MRLFQFVAFWDTFLVEQKCAHSNLTAAYMLKWTEILPFCIAGHHFASPAPEGIDLLDSREG